MTATAPRPRRVEGIVPQRAMLGITFLAIGAAMLGGSIVPGFDRYVLLSVAAICLAAFALTREYGFAIPAGITAGLGTMVLLNADGALTPTESGLSFFVPLAIGFAAIWVLGLVAAPRETNAWPLAPAAILGLLGLAVGAGQPAAFDWLQLGLAIAFALGGIGFVVRRGLR
jgi:hypothetical protein